jgi:hypothetical protein
MNCTLNITLFIQITNADEYILFKQEKKGNGKEVPELFVKV